MIFISTKVMIVWDVWMNLVPKQVGRKGLPEKTSTNTLHTV